MRKVFSLLFISLMVLGLASCDSSTQKTEETGGGEVTKETIDVSLFEDLRGVRFSSYESGTEVSTIHNLKQIAPYDDTYKVSTNANTKCGIYDTDGNNLLTLNVSEKGSLDLKKDQVVYVVAEGVAEKTLGYEVELVEHKSLLPYDPINLVNAEELLAVNKSDINPLERATVNYVKREGGMYINCNNPEKLTDACLNKALTRNDVSNKEVFFTFEHNNCVTGSFYYGYQVINKGTEDIYVTVKNIGFQLDGPGCWLGEKEWTDFYNTEFRIKSYELFTPSQMQTLDAYYSFCNTFRTPNYQPITYRIPAGQHIYVMGGTTKDSYNKTNVFKTANKKVAGGCSNGAVLFDVIGENVEAAFYAYKNPDKVQIDNQTHQGYVAVGEDGHEYGRQLIGYDNCHGVVDANLTWEFSDLTNPQLLPVTYTNYYKDGIKESGNTPYAEIESTPHVNNRTDWVTHINPQNSHAGVGTDMTKYYTVDKDGNPICIDSDHYDGLGYTANIGNWMIDYMENYTFVNHGSRDRQIKVSFTNTGSVAVLVRDANGKYIEGTAQYTICTTSASHGQPIMDIFEYVVTVPANGYLQFTVEYNLLANSSGYIKHTAKLLD